MFIFQKIFCCYLFGFWIFFGKMSVGGWRVLDRFQVIHCVEYCLVHDSLNIFFSCLLVCVLYIQTNKNQIKYTIITKNVQKSAPITKKEKKYEYTIFILVYFSTTKKTNDNNKNPKKSNHHHKPLRTCCCCTNTLYTMYITYVYIYINVCKNVCLFNLLFVCMLHRGNNKQKEQKVLSVHRHFD